MSMLLDFGTYMSVVMRYLYKSSMLMSTIVYTRIRILIRMTMSMLLDFGTYMHERAHEHTGFWYL